MKGVVLMDVNKRIPKKEMNKANVPKIRGTKVVVNNGDFEKALTMFNSAVKKEGVLIDYTRHQTFIPKRKKKGFSAGIGRSDIKE